MKNCITYIALVVLLFSCAEKSINNSNDLFTAHNHCVESVKPKLDQAKFNLEKLRIIYSEEMERLQVKIDSTNRFTNIKNCWNKAERMRVSSLKIKHRQQVDLLNEAYDNKYAEFISSLDENLRAIEKCKLIIGEENWYDQSDSTYYQSMIDKYKRN